jgi:hypothetical protein
MYGFFLGERYAHVLNFFTKEAILATASDESPVSAEKVLKRQKKQARREAKLMLEIEAAKKDLKKAQKKPSKVQPMQSQLLSRVKRPHCPRVRCDHRCNPGECNAGE